MRKRKEDATTTLVKEKERSLLDPFWEYFLPDEGDEDDCSLSVDSMSIDTGTETTNTANEAVEVGTQASFSLGSFPFRSKASEGSTNSAVGARTNVQSAPSVPRTFSYESATSTLSRVASLDAFSFESSNTHLRSQETRSTMFSVGTRSNASHASSAIDSKISRIKSKEKSRAPLDGFWEYVLGDKADADETVWASLDQVSEASSQVFDEFSQTLSDTLSGVASAQSVDQTSGDVSSDSDAIRRSKSDSAIEQNQRRLREMFGRKKSKRLNETGKQVSSETPPSKTSEFWRKKTEKINSVARASLVTGLTSVVAAGGALRRRTSSRLQLSQSKAPESNVSTKRREPPPTGQGTNLFAAPKHEKGQPFSLMSLGRTFSNKQVTSLTPNKTVTEDLARAIEIREVDDKRKKSEKINSVARASLVTGLTSIVVAGGALRRRKSSRLQLSQSKAPESKLSAKRREPSQTGTGKNFFGAPKHEKVQPFSLLSLGKSSSNEQVTSLTPKKTCTDLARTKKIREVDGKTRGEGGQPVLAGLFSTIVHVKQTREKGGKVSPKEPPPKKKVEETQVKEKAYKEVGSKTIGATIFSKVTPASKSKELPVQKVCSAKDDKLDDSQSGREGEGSRQSGVVNLLSTISSKRVPAPGEPDVNLSTQTLPNRNEGETKLNRELTDQSVWEGGQAIITSLLASISLGRAPSNGPVRELLQKPLPMKSETEETRKADDKKSEKGGQSGMGTFFAASPLVLIAPDGSGESTKPSGQGRDEATKERMKEAAQNGEKDVQTTVGRVIPSGAQGRTAPNEQTWKWSAEKLSKSGEETKEKKDFEVGKGGNLSHAGTANVFAKLASHRKLARKSPNHSPSSKDDKEPGRTSGEHWARTFDPTSLTPQAENPRRRTLTAYSNPQRRTQLSVDRYSDDSSQKTIGSFSKAISHNITMSDVLERKNGSQATKEHWQWEIDSTAIPAIRSLRTGMSPLAASGKQVNGRVRFTEDAQVISPRVTSARVKTSRSAWIGDAKAMSASRANDAEPQEPRSTKGMPLRKIRPPSPFCSVGPLKCNEQSERQTPKVRSASYQGIQPENMFNFHPEIDVDALTFRRSGSPWTFQADTTTSTSDWLCAAANLSNFSQLRGSNAFSSNDPVEPKRSGAKSNKFWQNRRNNLKRERKAASPLVPTGSDSFTSDWEGGGNFRYCCDSDKVSDREVVEESDEETTVGDDTDEGTSEAMSNESISSGNRVLLLQSLLRAKASQSSSKSSRSAVKRPQVGVYKPGKIVRQRSSSQAPFLPASSIQRKDVQCGRISEGDSDSEAEVEEIRRKLWDDNKGIPSGIHGGGDRGDTYGCTNESRTDPFPSGRQVILPRRASPTGREQRAILL